MARASCALGVLLLAAPALAEPVLDDPAREAAVAKQIEAARESPPALRVLLRGMPKGGDLHNHLGGAIYAEDYLTWAGAKGFCVDETGLSVEPPPCPAERTIERFAATNEFGMDRLIDAMSTRGFQRGVGQNDASGHTQFFRSFDRFGKMGGETAQMLTAARRIAAGDKVSYLELDHNTTALVSVVRAAGDAPITESDLAAVFAGEAKEFAALIPKARAELDADEAASAKAMACGTPAAEPACKVAVHYLFQALRALPPRQVYRSLILGFMMAAADPRFVGVNIVMPEDAWLARRDYALHMAMIRFLAARYPKVKLTLHAGEVTLGQVPPQDLKDHIAQAVAAGAKRIGHGTGIAFEDKAEDTMARMAKEGIAVEINLTSNAVILGVKGADHPLRLYRAHGVPVVLSTDDEGVLRSDMTNEYVRAVREQGLTYPELKEIARAGLHYSFVPGGALWTDPVKRVPVSVCADFATPSCAKYLSDNEKARLQMDLEQRFAAFEAERLARAGKVS
ncbi:adenosine deaminase [Novosphingobium sediminis]|uniref:adenosine deaminase n=1 Tax=Novosphingobium sediminis TaxID=707214 RepID=A0A512ALQ7_9SPHN|nr:adenosine deaminase [Novosphingobium sediminis]GEO00653.1 adenosine deaminase [Novosphingobium sediminis]